jgi:hypothetical protein
MAVTLIAALRGLIFVILYFIVISYL